MMVKDLRTVTMSFWILHLMGSLSTEGPSEEPLPTASRKTFVKICGTTSKFAILKGLLNWTENSFLGTKTNMKAMNKKGSHLFHNHFTISLCPSLVKHFASIEWGLNGVSNLIGPSHHDGN